MSKFLKLVDELGAIDKNFCFKFEYWDDLINVSFGFDDIDEFTVKIDRDKRCCVLLEEYQREDMNTEDVRRLHSVMFIIESNIDALLGSKQIQESGQFVHNGQNFVFV